MSGWQYPCCLEVAWLAGLWLLVPASRPWPPARTVAAPTPAAWALARAVLLHSYVFYHLPVLLLPGATKLLDVGRVRPAGFAALGAATAVAYTITGLLGS